MKKILKCTKCGAYTLKNACPECGAQALSPQPPKFSPEDKYAKYRRAEKKKLFIERGLL